MKEAKKGLKQRLDSGELSRDEYDKITDALGQPSQSARREMVVAYRNRLLHRIRPSVDYAELFTEVEDRQGEAIVDAAGNVKGRKFDIKARPGKPEYEFTELYAALLDYLKYVIAMLTALKGVQRLA